ncbi:ArsR family transcriptional regulator [Candidatus Bathyarchaeota archaeon]|nr:ArsR family transcriptional regulator [Candidatus Bathyarchaeota archaeon]
MSIMLIDDPEKIEILNEPTRRQILRLLSDREMTMTQIARELGISKRSVWYHLRVLLKRNLIVLSKKKVNAYGIEEKYYRAKALVMIGDFNKSSKRIRGETLESNIDIVIGYLCAKKIDEPISDEKIERIAEKFTETLQKVIENNEKIGKTRNQTKLAIYREAFRILEKNKWI